MIADFAKNPLLHVRLETPKGPMKATIAGSDAYTGEKTGIKSPNLEVNGQICYFPPLRWSITFGTRLVSKGNEHKMAA